MLAAATAGSFDVLLTGYFDRWQRNLRRTLELVEDRLHPSGVAWVMCDRRLMSSDPRDWDQMVTEAHEAERYSRRLGERITDGYAAKFRLLADPGGRAPLGFVRIPPAFVLAIDPDAIDVAVRIFRAVCRRHPVDRSGCQRIWPERSARHGDAEEPGLQRLGRAKGRADARALARRATGVGRVVGAGRDAARKPGPSRGQSSPARIDLLRGLLYCVCGQRIRTDGTMGLHPGSGSCIPGTISARSGVRRRATPSSVYEPWIIGQVTGIRVDESTLERIVRVLSTPETRPSTSTGPVSNG